MVDADPFSDVIAFIKDKESIRRHDRRKRHKQPFRPLATELARLDTPFLFRDAALIGVRLPDERELFALRHYGIRLDIDSEVARLELTERANILIVRIRDGNDFKPVSLRMFKDFGNADYI